MHISPSSPALSGAVTRAARAMPQYGTATDNAAPPASPYSGGRRHEYALADLSRALGVRHLTIKTIIAHLRALARDCDMPLPKTPRLYAGKIVHGADSIHKGSRWDAELFDAWLDRRDGTVAPVPEMPTGYLRQEMANRARLVVIQGGKP